MEQHSTNESQQDRRPTLEEMLAEDRQQKRKRRSEALDATEPFVLALVGAVTISEVDNIVMQAFGVAAILLAFRRFLKGG